MTRKPRNYWQCQPHFAQRRAYRRALCYEQLEDRHVLSAVSFTPREVFATEVPQSAFAADIDLDGGADVLVADYGSDKIAWYENTDGQGVFGEKQVITNVAAGAFAVSAADIDGDGDIDVLSASYEDDKIAWYENTDGQGTFGPPRIITNSAEGAVSVVAADVDGDGDLDVLSAAFDNNTIAWYENIDSLGNFGPEQVIATSAAAASWVFAADVDGDGDVDVLSSSTEDDKIAWYENTDGQGSFGAQRVISTDGDRPASVVAADIDGDGDVDVLAASIDDDTIAWYENTDGNGSFGSQRTITSTADGAIDVFATDVDGDGDIDVLAASDLDDTIAWYENADGKGNFGSSRIVSTSSNEPVSVFAADVDGDGDMDVLSAAKNDPLNGVIWNENIDGLGTFGPDHTILVQEGSYAVDSQSVFAADVDGDGDVDVLSASSGDDKIAWYENDGQGSFAKQHVISTLADGARSVFAADLDGDGDTDVLSASGNGGKIAWYENTDGQGDFGPQRLISSNAETTNIVAVDVDRDGDLDVLSTTRRGIAWYENTNGQGTFGPQRASANNFALVRSVFAADLNGDGGMDALVGATDGIAWFGYSRGSFSSPRFITTSDDQGGFVFVHAADVDGDGDQDVIAATDTSEESIAWYENTDGQGNFGPRQLISLDGEGVTSIFAADLDGDGDVDLATASRFAPNVAWYENTDGQGTFGPASALTLILPEMRFPLHVIAADVDGDGDTDVLAASFVNIAWYENIDETGDFGSEHVIAMTFGLFHSISTADIDGDGDLDLLTASGIELRWYENTDGKGTFSKQHLIAGGDDRPLDILGADVDGDGDMDVVAAWRSQGSPASRGVIAWHQNLDGHGSFGSQRVVMTGFARSDGISVSAADIDNDGDLDLRAGVDFSSENYSDSIVWFSNLTGTGSFGGPQLVTSGGGGAGFHVDDIDGDGDMDVLSVSMAWYENTNGRGNFIRRVVADIAGTPFAADVDGDGDLDILTRPGGIVWLENTDDGGNFLEPQLVSSVEGGAGLDVGDIDGDGDLDVVSANHDDHSIIWYENRTVLPGDYNGDGKVSAADYTLWRNTLGQGVTPFTGADGSGNGVIDKADYDLWKANFGNIDSSRPPVAALAGDYNSDGAVTAADYAHWRNTLGQSVIPSTGADGDGSGSIDQADYDLWKANYQSAAATGSNLEVSTSVGRNSSDLPSTAIGVIESSSATVARRARSFISAVAVAERLRARVTETQAAVAPTTSLSEDLLLATLVGEESSATKPNAGAPSDRADKNSDHAECDALFAVLGEGAKEGL